MSEYSDWARHYADAIEMDRRTTSMAITAYGIKAVTFALLDVAAAIREHASK